VQVRLTAITIQHTLMYGLKRSPILAHFQKTPVKALGHKSAYVVVGSPRCLPILVSVHDSGEELVDVCAGADEEEQDEQRGIEVEEGRLGRS
jgi:hypothetical protein